MNENSLIQSQKYRILHFFLRIFDEFFSGFRAKFQKIVTCAAFSIKFAKTNQKFAENSEFCEKKFTIISELFTSLLIYDARRVHPPRAAQRLRSQRPLNFLNFLRYFSSMMMSSNFHTFSRRAGLRHIP